MFRYDSKRFYRELGKKTFQIEKPTDKGEVKKFWQNILEQEVKHNEDAQWINDQEEELQQINQIEWKDLTVEELRVNMTRAANWKSPGPDRLPNFWIKQFKSLHQSMAEAYFQIVKDPKQTQDWLVEGATNLLPKKEETWIPKNYRPIACLPATFKILASVITDVQSSRERSHHDTRIERRKERLLWVQGSVDDQQCYLRKLQEEEEELVNSLDRLQESL